MADRLIFTSSSTPPVGGGAALDKIAEKLKMLFDGGHLPLTGVAGTGDAVTATLDPVLDGSGLVDGMLFSITWGASNTGAVTLSINGGTALPVVDSDNVGLAASTLVAGRRSLLEYVGGSFRILSSVGGGASGGGPAYQVFTASGTWTKPTGYDPDTLVRVELWGGGGGGGRGVGGNANAPSGGGGGGYAEGLFRMADLAASVAVTIGAGGTPAAAASGSGGVGGTSSFGTLLTAYGGGGGSGPSALGGGGGGVLGPGVTGGGGGPMGGGPGGSGAVDGNGNQNNDAAQPFGGGGGKSGNAANSGGRAIYGGGGGSSATGLGGTSVFGGRGGNGPTGTTPDNGVAPGGGGGGSAANNSAALAGAGARGECRVWILG